MSKKPITCGKCANFYGFSTTKTGRMSRAAIGHCRIAAAQVVAVREFAMTLPPSVTLAAAQKHRVWGAAEASRCRQYVAKSKASVPAPGITLSHENNQSSGKVPPDFAPKVAKP